MKFKKLTSLVLTFTLLLSIISVPVYGTQNTNYNQEVRKREIPTFRKITPQIIEKYISGEEVVNDEIKSQMQFDPEMDRLLMDVLEKQKQKTNRFIIKYKDSKSKDKVYSKLNTYIKSSEEVKNEKFNSNLEIVYTNEKIFKEKIIKEIKDKGLESEIEYIQPDYKLSIASIDNQWGLYNSNNNQNKEDKFRIDANVITSWEVSDGEGVIVAVIDTGIDITHDDLKNNIWTNTNEINDNGIDDDNNGYIDDINGWDFNTNTNKVHDPQNIYSEVHGTHLAGIIGAEKDNEIGIVGVAPKVEIMPLKVFQNGDAYTSEIIESIEYAENMGADIVNCSWGSTAQNPALEEAIENSNMLFVCAAGNSGKNIDVEPVYPAALDCQNVITVASMKNDGFLSAFSNRGVKSVDVAAPGESILSTTINNDYVQNSGASMATAFVTGEAALILANNQQLNASQIKETIINTSDSISSLINNIKKGNKINCYNGVNNIIKKETINLNNLNEFKKINIENISNENYQEKYILYSVKEKEEIDCGGFHSIHLKNDGTVWSLGLNSCGQLGDGTTINQSLPVQVHGLTDVEEITGGSYYSMALKSNGTVWSWGHNGYGQLGDGTITDRLIPIQVQGLTDVILVAGGYRHSMALKSDGTVWTWGDNSYGQLGDGTTTNKLTPVQVQGLTNVESIACGYYYSMALKSDGTVWTWGDNCSGQLGDGTTTNKLTPIQVQGLTNVEAVSCGVGHSIALKSDGTVWSWGENYYNQLGDGTTTNRLTPIQVQGLTGVEAISCKYCHSTALKTDGTVWTWGLNTYGQLGDGTTTNKSTPVQVQGLSNVVKIAGGYVHSIALTSEGVIWSWGNNEYGQLGDGCELIREEADIVESLDSVNTVDAKFCHNIISKSDRTVWTWGFNGDGQLGDGTTANRHTPVQVQGLTNVIKVAGGYNHSIALKSDGTVWDWGHNEHGQLGNGTVINESTPIQVQGLTDVIEVAGGSFHSIALKNDGTVWTWGCNFFGQLGDGTATSNSTPVQVQGLTDVIKIAGGSFHSIAVKSDGTVWTWGYNQRGQMGAGTSIDKLIPVQIQGLTDVIEVAGGYNHSIALKSDGTVWSWGDNQYCQLGDGRQLYKTIPVSYGADITKQYKQLNCIQGDEYWILINGQNIDDTEQKTYKITYDVNVLSVEDLSSLTYEKETTTGNIQETGINITSFTPGIITFTKTANIQSNQQWDGCTNIIKFKSLATCQTTISFEIE